LAGGGFVAGFALKANKFDGIYLGKVEGTDLVCAGKVPDLQARLKPLIRKTQPYAGTVEPSLLAEIKYRAKPADGKCGVHFSNGTREDFMIREPILRLSVCVSLSTFCLVIWTTSVTAQTKSEDKKPGDSTYSTGRTVLPDNKGQLQPQGWTGPLSTDSGGAPAESPQGGTPPPMQPAPGGASKSIVDPSPPGR
jgi:hypothetical protein